MAGVGTGGVTNRCGSARAPSVRFDGGVARRVVSAELPQSPSLVVGRTDFAADACIPRPRRVNRRSSRRAGAAEHLSERSDLFGCETRVSLRTGTRECGEFRFDQCTAAPLEVLNHCVHNTIEVVTRREDRVRHEHEVVVRERLVQERLVVLVHEVGGARHNGERLTVPRLGDSRARQTETRRAGEHAVEMIREALREHHPLASALRTSDEIRLLGRPAVVPE